MSENDVHENLAFLNLNDPGDESDATAAPEETAPAAEETVYEPAPQEAVYQAPEDPNERRFRGVLNELRDTRQELRAYREQVANLEAQRNEIREQRESPPIPDKDADPAAWLAYQNRLAIYEVEQQRLDQEDYERAEQESAQVRQQFYSTVTGLENQIRSQRPDYDQAVAFTKEIRARELEGFGYTQDQIADQIQREVVGFTALHLRQGLSPAEAAYSYAYSRGYRPQGGYQQQSSPQPSFQQQAPRMNASLSSVTGSSGAGRAVTLENLAHQPVSTQDFIMDNPELWERINLGEKVYL